MPCDCGCGKVFLQEILTHFEVLSIDIDTHVPIKMRMLLVLEV